MLAMLPAWRGLPLRTDGICDAALGYLIVGVAIGVVILDINAPRSPGRAGRLGLAAAPILFLNCSTLNDIVALNAPAFKFVADPMRTRAAIHTRQPDRHAGAHVSFLHAAGRPRARVWRKRRRHCKPAAP